MIINSSRLEQPTPRRAPNVGQLDLELLLARQPGIGGTGRRVRVDGELGLGRRELAGRYVQLLLGCLEGVFGRQHLFSGGGMLGSEAIESVLQPFGVQLAAQSGLLVRLDLLAELLPNVGPV
jgi:hypothetical protein